MLKSLKGFILIVTVMISLTFFGGTYFIFSRIYTGSISENAHKVSASLAQHTFNSMFQIMSKGWERAELEEFIASTKKSVEDTPIDINIYRGETVTQLFGPIEQGEMDAQIMKAFREGMELRQSNDATTRYVFPLKAEQKCLGCHVNAKAGTVLGVIDVKQNLAPFIGKAKYQFFLSLIVLAPVPFLAALLMVLFVNRRIGRSIGKLGKSIDSITKVSDLQYLELEEFNLSFSELNEVAGKFKELSGKLKSIAVDKDLLEFEIRLLEKFVITSGVIKDWHEYVSLLLTKINKVITTYSLFSIFKVDEGVFELVIFWHHEPSSQTKALLEKVVRKLLAENPLFSDESAIAIVHKVSDSTRNLRDLSESDIEKQMRSLLVETPKIGDIVGIGVQADLISEDTRKLVMGSILSTLLNVVGSIKAIHKYTCELEYYATRDPLTKLYNQRMFWDLFEYEIGRSRRHSHKFALMVIDMDNFKSVNDTYGHSFGDTFLQKIADVMREALRTEDILTRYGGDEFVVILPETSEDEATTCAKRMIDAICSMNVATLDGTIVRGTVSIGLGVYPDHAAEKKDLFMFADNMMYKAKSEGRNRIGIPTEDDVIESFRHTSATSIIVMNAVENKDRDIVPYFHPLVDTRTRKIEAVEVLGRIRLGDGEILEAGEFIEIAEKIGVIHKFDYIILEKALQVVRNQNFQGNIFLNLSPRALTLNAYIPEVRRIVSESEIDPGRIIFEITERETIKKMALLETFVRNLKMEGYKLAIDDFGSGFSSFNYLKRFPVDYLKIEGDFIVNMTSSERDMAFVRSISMLARELGILTVAEYVENEEVLRSVSDIGIDLAQGYFISKPSADLPPC